MASAAACSAISWSLLPPELLACISQTKDIQPVSFNILAASTGEVFSAKVLTQYGKLWVPKSSEGFRIAGVPGLAAPVELKFPLNASSLPTGRLTDSVSVDGEIASHLSSRGGRSTIARSTK
jgi:2-methylaconitate cis-trans-isomerase PrpF